MSENFSSQSLRVRNCSLPVRKWFRDSLHVMVCFLSAEESLSDILLQRDDWGQLVESAIGAHLLNNIMGSNMNLYYWRQRGDEVDFILEYGSKIIGIEVKSGASNFHKGTAVFKGKYHPYKVLLVGDGGIEIEDFLQLKLEDLF